MQKLQKSWNYTVRFALDHHPASGTHNPNRQEANTKQCFILLAIKFEQNSTWMNYAAAVTIFLEHAGIGCCWSKYSVPIKQLWHFLFMLKGEYQGEIDQSYILMRQQTRTEHSRLSVTAVSL